MSLFFRKLCPLGCHAGLLCGETSHMVHLFGKVFNSAFITVRHHGEICVIKSFDKEGFCLICYIVIFFVQFLNIFLMSACAHV